MSDKLLISPANPLPLNQPTAKATKKSESNFGEMLNNTIENVNQLQLSGEEAITKLQTGKAEHLHEVMIAVEQADISLRMLVQMRNRAQTAYEEIMRMQL